MENRKQYIIAYDISDPKIRSQIKKTCEHFGFRIQYSIFSCHLTHQHLEKLCYELKKITGQSKKDNLIESIIIFSLCKECEARSIIIGNPVNAHCIEKSIII